jgi:hypothetical protein
MRPAVYHVKVTGGVCFAWVSGEGSVQEERHPPHSSQPTSLQSGGTETYSGRESNGIEPCECQDESTHFFQTILLLMAVLQPSVLAIVLLNRLLLKA